MKKQSFNKENPTELFSQLVKVLTREKDRGKMTRLIDDLKDVSKKVFVEIKKPRLAMKNRVAKFVEAIYYYDKPKIYRPNFNELDTQLFSCPKCKSKLSLPRTKVLKPVYVCPCCSFKIPYDNVLGDRKRVEEYMAENKKKKQDEKLIADVTESEKNKEADFIKESE